MPDKRVYVEFLADTRKLKTGLKDADKRVSKLSTAFKRLGGVIAGAFAGRAVFNALRQTLKTTDDLIKTAKGVGFTAREYERLAFAMDAVGVNAESLRIGLGDLQKRLGNENFAKFYEAIGLTQEQLLSQNPAQQLETVLEALRRVPDELLVTRAGGVLEEQSGKDFAKVIRQWEEFARARQDYDRIVSPLDADARERIEQLTYQTRLFDQQWENLKRTVVIDSAPEIIKAMQSVSDSGAISTITSEIAGLIHEINALVADIKYLGGVFDGLELPEWVKTIYNLSGISALTAVSKVPLNSLRSSRESSGSGDLSPWLPAPAPAQSGGTTTLNQTNNITVPSNRVKGSVESAIRDSNEKLFREMGFRP